MGDGNEGHKKADIFCKSVKTRIGTAAAPKLSPEALGFVAENLASDSAFKAINGNNGKQAQALRKRRQAFLSIKSYVELIDDVNDQNPSCKADGAGVEKCYKEFVFGAFKEILVLDVMYEQVRIGGDPINPNGHYRAFGATADQIHMSTGGLSGFLTQGEPTLVSMMVMAIEAQENANSSTGVIPPPLMVTPPHHNPVQHQPLDHGKRDRETSTEGKVQMTVPPFNWVCAFCHKPSHSSLVCRDRIKQDKARMRGGFNGGQQTPPQQRTPPQVTSPATPTTGGSIEEFNQFKRYQEWLKSQN